MTIKEGGTCEASVGCERDAVGAGSLPPRIRGNSGRRLTLSVGTPCLEISLRVEHTLILRKFSFLHVHVSRSRAFAQGLSELGKCTGHQWKLEIKPHQLRGGEELIDPIRNITPWTVVARVRSLPTSCHCVVHSGRACLTSVADLSRLHSSIRCP